MFEEKTMPLGEQGTSQGYGGKMYELWAIYDKVDGGRARWMKMGVGFPNRDSSINLKMDAFPTGHSGLQLRERKPRDNSFAGAQQEGGRLVA